MQIEITSSGSPAHVKTEVANAVDRYGKEHPAEAWPALVNIRDYAAYLVNAAPADAEIELALKVEVAVKYEAEKE